MTAQQAPLPFGSPRLAKPAFAGKTFVPERDEARLGAQLTAVRDFMLRVRGFWTLHDISEQLGYPEASVSARLRDLRRLGFTVERRYVERGLHEYAVSAAVPEKKP